MCQLPQQARLDSAALPALLVALPELLAALPALLAALPELLAALPAAAVRASRLAGWKAAERRGLAAAL